MGEWFMPVIEILHHVKDQQRGPGKRLVGKESALGGRACLWVDAHRGAHFQVGIDHLAKQFLG